MKYVFILLLFVSFCRGQNQTSICILPANPPYIDQGFMPFGGVSGDFDGDGKIDLITHTNTMPGLSRFFGNGNGTFSVAPLFPINGGLDCILLTSDFNNDGLKDLVLLQRKAVWASALTSDSMLILLGIGNGNFLRTTAYSLPDKPYGAVIGKFNLDAAPDIAVSFLNQTFFNVYHGIGNGNFLSPTQYTTNTSALRLIYTDINNDGKNDIIKGTQIFKGLTNGTFSTNPSFMAINGTPSLAVNLNNDQLPDFISINSNVVYLSVNAGNNIFNQIQSISVPNAVTSIGKIDLDSDGISDFGIGIGSQISFYAKGSANYQAVSTNSFPAIGGPWCWGQITDDFNNDQREDAAVLLDNSKGPHIFLNCNNKDVGIQSENFENFALFPNPTKHYQYLNLPDNFSTETSTLSISNFLGEQYYPNVSRINEKTLRIDLQEYVAGIYFLQLINTDSKLHFQKKIVLQD